MLTTNHETINLVDHIEIARLSSRREQSSIIKLRYLHNIAMQSQCSSYSSEEDEDEEPKTPERKNKVIDSPIVTPSPGNINSFEGRPVYLLLKCCLLLLCLMLAVVGCISIFRFQFSHISNHSNDAATSRNVRSVSIDIDRVLLEQLATINPKSRTVSQLLKDRPDLFVKTTHDQARQRFRYLNSKRSNDSDSFFELCNIHSIQISSEARIAILEDPTKIVVKKKHKHQKQDIRFIAIKKRFFFYSDKCTYIIFC